MSISRDRLEARLIELKRQAELLKQQYNAVVGAIAELEHWLQAPTHAEGDTPPVEKD